MREIQVAARPSVLVARRCEYGLRVAVLVCMLLGPPTGLFHAVHLATAGHDHHADTCSFCQQVALSSTYVHDSAISMRVSARIVWMAGGVRLEERPQTFAPPYVFSRAPPESPLCQA